MYDTDDIKRYILFLKNECGLSVTLHPCSEEEIISTSELISFNIHDNSYCVCVKTFRECQAHCIERQKKVFEKCKQGSFCGVCYAGVREYVYPIKKRDEVLGFISVSGYRTENAESYMKRTAREFGASRTMLSSVYPSLKSEMPPKDSVDTLIVPLCNMLELAYLKCEGEGSHKAGLVDGVVRYMKAHHTEKLTVDSIAQHFCCSRSHICHSFKQKIGKTVVEYLTELRLDDARSLLRYSALSVTEIAYAVGFGDSNYFSNVFKRHEGINPSEYRKRVSTSF